MIKFIDKIKKLTLVNIKLLALAILIFASCKTTKQGLDAAAKTEVQSGYSQLPNALLWEISGNGLTKPSYLYGTIHLIDKESFFYPTGTLEALEKTEDIYFEIDMDDMNDMSKMMGMMDDIFMKDGKTLKDILSEDDYKMVNAHFQTMGLPMFMLEKMKPMFLTVFASGDIDMGSMMGGGGNKDSNTKSYEFEFYELASTMNKEVGGLETIQFQMGIFDKIPYEDQAQMLVESIKMVDAGEDQLKAMTDMYVAQDINSMVSMIDEDPSGFGKYNDILLVERNKNWIPLMSEKMKLEPTFFAVGAGHLAGKTGVIHLLRQSGFTLTPVKS